VDGPAHARIEQLTIISSIALDRHTKNAEAVARQTDSTSRCDELEPKMRESF
jgi:hypothetical protein